MKRKSGCQYNKEKLCISRASSDLAPHITFNVHVYDDFKNLSIDEETMPIHVCSQTIKIYKTLKNIKAN